MEFCLDRDTLCKRWCCSDLCFRIGHHFIAADCIYEIQNLSVALALFVLMGFCMVVLMVSGSILRHQYYSAGIIFKRKQLLKYFLVVFIAFLFHRSAIVMLFLYPVYRKINQVNIFLSAVVLGYSFYSGFLFSVAG